METPAFNPANVPIQLTLSATQVELCLTGLQSLPIGQAGDFFFGLKQHAERTIESARLAHESTNMPAPPAPIEQQPVTPEQEA